MQRRHSRKLIPAKISKNRDFRKGLYRKPYFLINNTENWSLVSFLLEEVTKISSIVFMSVFTPYTTESVPGNTLN